MAMVGMQANVLGEALVQMIQDPNMRAALEDELLHLREFKRPWSGKALVRLGKSIRESLRVDEYTSDYMEIMAHYQALSVSVQVCIEADCNSGRSENERLSITSRAKSIDTLRDKLRRTPSVQLPAIRDIAGVRVEGPMVLDQQDELARSLCALFGHSEDVIRDMRAKDHSGYRAVHLWLDFPAGRVEVQIRTTLQGAWANAYEKAADVFGRGIRYGDYPDDATIVEEVRSLQYLSTERIAMLEEIRNNIWISESQLPNAQAKMEKMLSGKTHRRKRIHKKRQKILRRNISRLPDVERRLAQMKEVLRKEEEETHRLAKNLENAYMMMINS